MELREKMTGRNIVGFLLLGLSLMMLGKSVQLCFCNDIWYDELFTVGLIGHSYGELIRLTAADVHPPLYYCIIKVFADLCKLIVPGADTVILAKLASILPYGILVVYSVTLIRRRFGMLTAGLFSFCILAMPQLSAYTVEMRMYGWAMLFVTAAFLHAWELTEYYVNYCDANYGNRKPAFGKDAADTPHGGNRADETAAGTETGRNLRTCFFHAAALVLHGLAAAYTQYFAAVAVGMVYLFVLIVLLARGRSGIRTWLFCAAASAAGYAPWLVALTGQLHAVGENYWILPLTWRSLGGCVKFLMKPAFTSGSLSTVVAVILFCGCGAAVWYVVVSGLKGRRHSHGCSYENAKKSKKLSYNGRVLDMQNQARERETAVFVLAGLSVLAGLVAFGFAASFLFRPIFVYRYMIPAAGCFWLSVAVAVGELCKLENPTKQEGELCKLEEPAKRKGELCKPKISQKPTEKSGKPKYRPAAVARTAARAFLILFIIVGLRDYCAFWGEEEYKAVCMRETRTALALIEPQDSVLYNFDQVEAVTGWYLPAAVERYLWRAEAEKLIQEITSPCAAVEDVEEIYGILEKTREKGTDGGNGGSVWLIGSFNSRDDIVEEWRAAGLTVEEQGSFLLERYWFNLYKIS